MKCPRCDGLLRAMNSKIIEKDGKHYMLINLYCYTKGCPANNGQPVQTNEVEVNDNVDE